MSKGEIKNLNWQSVRFGNSVRSAFRTVAKPYLLHDAADRPLAGNMDAFRLQTSDGWRRKSGIWTI